MDHSWSTHRYAPAREEENHGIPLTPAVVTTVVGEVVLLVERKVMWSGY